MNKIAVICPTRNRPHNLARLHQALIDTNFTGLFIVGLDDDNAEIYLENTSPRYESSIYEINPRMRLASTLNFLAMKYINDCDIVGFIGDDSLPYGSWEKDILEVFKHQPTGFVYTNDLYQGAALAGTPFISTNIIQALGYMCPPKFIHLFIDNVWLDMGSRAGCIKYLENTIIEHLHPVTGKGISDKGYDEVDSSIHADHIAYNEWLSQQADRDIQIIKGLL